MYYSADDYVGPITFEGGPVTHKERKRLLQSINQYVPYKKTAKSNTETANGDSQKGVNLMLTYSCYFL